MRGTALDTDLAVVIAYRDMGCEYRRAAFNYVKAYYEEWLGDNASFFTGTELIVESGDSDATFTRASAINAAIMRAEAQTIVQVDPDSLVPGATLRTAVQVALGTGTLVIPHSEFLYLDPEATTSILTHEAELAQVTPTHCETYGVGGPGNVVVFTRGAWRAAGGFDERFGLWGGDDAAFRYAVEAFRGPAERLQGPMWHLWHPRPPQSVPGHPGYTEQFALLAQYRDAAAIGPQAVRDLVRNRT